MQVRQCVMCDLFPHIVLLLAGSILNVNHWTLHPPRRLKVSYGKAKTSDITLYKCINTHLLFTNVTLHSRNHWYWYIQPLWKCYINKDVVLYIIKLRAVQAHAMLDIAEAEMFKFSGWFSRPCMWSGQYKPPWTLIERLCGTTPPPIVLPPG